MTRLCMIGLAACIGGAAAAAGEADKAALPVTATLVAKQKTYTLNRGGMTAEAYKKATEDAVQAGKAPPAPPTVDLALELKNTSAKEVQVWVGGTQLQIDLDLRGPGALSVKPRSLLPVDRPAAQGDRAGAGQDARDSDPGDCATAGAAGRTMRTGPSPANTH